MRAAGTRIGQLCSAVALMAGPELVRAASSAAQPPQGMAWIPAGEFTMGTDDTHSLGNERPSHRVQLNGFWMDTHTVTHAKFSRFVEATDYLTTSERKPDWEEIKKQVPAGTPKPPDYVLVAGSLVFVPAKQAVSLNDMRGSQHWVPAANWKNPEGPVSTITGRENHPVVHISWDDGCFGADHARCSRLRIRGPQTPRL